MATRIAPLRWINLLWKKRVPQGLALFLGAVWGLVEVVSFLVERYRLTDNIVDMVGLGALLLCPSVLVWMMRHRPDPDDLVDSRDVTVAGGNLLLSAGIVFAVFGGEAVGRATDTITVEDEAGDMVQREVPRQDLLRALAIAPLQRADADTPEWLGIAVAQGLQLDLSQNAFIQLTGNEESFATVEGDPGDITVARRQAIARRANAHFFGDGEVSGTMQRMRVALTVYRTDPLRPVATLHSEGLALDATIDALSPALRDALELPADRAAGGADGPVGALLSEDSEAVAAVFRAEYLLSTARDIAGAQREIEAALARDPEFAMAGLRLFYLGASSGNTEAMKRGLEAAYENRERFTEELRCVVRTIHASYQGQQDSAKRIARACVEQFPNNTQTRTYYAEFLRIMDDDIEGAIAQYQAILALGSANDRALLQIAQLQRRTGDEAGAIRSYTEYLALKPDDPAATQALADLELRDGRRAEARERLLDAIARNDEASGLASALASLHLRAGNFDQALAAVQEYADHRSPEKQLVAIRVREQVAEARGRIHEALALRDRSIALAPPGTGTMMQLLRAAHYGEELHEGAGMAAFEELLAAGYPGTDDIATASRELMRLMIALRIGDVADLRRGREALDLMLARYGRRDLAFMVPLAEGRAAQLEGDPRRAADRYAEAYAGHRRSGGDQVFGELPLLRFWLEAAAEARDRSAGETPARVLERLQPGYPMSLLTRARFEAATGQPARAAALVEQALAAWQDADEGYAPRAQAEALRDSLAGE